MSWHLDLWRGREEDDRDLFQGSVDEVNVRVEAFIRRQRRAYDNGDYLAVDAIEWDALMAVARGLGWRPRNELLDLNAAKLLEVAPVPVDDGDARSMGEALTKLLEIDVTGGRTVPWGELVTRLPDRMPDGWKPELLAWELRNRHDQLIVGVRGFVARGAFAIS